MHRFTTPVPGGGRIVSEIKVETDATRMPVFTDLLHHTDLDPPPTDLDTLMTGLFINPWFWKDHTIPSPVVLSDVIMLGSRHHNVSIFDERFAIMPISMERLKVTRPVDFGHIIKFHSVQTLVAQHVNTRADFDSFLDHNLGPHIKFFLACPRFAEKAVLCARSRDEWKVVSSNTGLDFKSDLLKTYKDKWHFQVLSQNPRLHFWSKTDFTTYPWNNALLARNPAIARDEKTFVKFLTHRCVMWEDLAQNPAALKMFSREFVGRHWNRIKYRWGRLFSSPEAAMHINTLHGICALFQKPVMTLTANEIVTMGVKGREYLAGMPGIVELLRKHRDMLWMWDVGAVAANPSVSATDLLELFPKSVKMEHILRKPDFTCTMLTLPGQDPDIFRIATTRIKVSPIVRYAMRGWCWTEKTAKLAGPIEIKQVIVDAPPTVETLREFQSAAVAEILGEVSDSGRRCPLCQDMMFAHTLSIVTPCIHCYHTKCWEDYTKRGFGFCPSCRGKVFTVMTMAECNAMVDRIAEMRAETFDINTLVTVHSEVK